MEQAALKATSRSTPIQLKTPHPVAFDRRRLLLQFAM
jgi:hypothetical protein